MDNAGIKKLIEDGIPFVKKTGVKLDVCEKGRIRVSLKDDPTNMNPIGIYHAGATFTLAETAGAALLLTVFDMSKTSFIGKAINIQFRKPGKGDLFCDMEMSDDDVDSILKVVGEQGKLDKSFPLEIKDSNDVVVAQADCIFHFRKVG